MYRICLLKIITQQSFSIATSQQRYFRPSFLPSFLLKFSGLDLLYQQPQVVIKPLKPVVLFLLMWLQCTQPTFKFSLAEKNRRSTIWSYVIQRFCNNLIIFYASKVNFFVLIFIFILILPFILILYLYFLLHVSSKVKVIYLINRH